MSLHEQALEYHAKGRPGKIEINTTKPCATAADLSLAYSPGVAEPCRAIHEKDDDVYLYTGKGNLVAVVTNGTAVLGLGNIGPHAAKPVMEGKAVLFKRFADIDVFDIELNAKTAKEVIAACKAIAPTFGGINLEDIKAPECFEIEETLTKELDIPVFHDDQHGTAIITSAALINALEITGRDPSRTKFVFSGAGSAAIACANLFLKFGVNRDNIVMCDSKGAVFEGRTDYMDPYKARFATKRAIATLSEAMVDADVFIGLSAAGVVTQAMVKSMAKNPIIFAMANPDPEILPEKILEVRTDAIIATGRSDYPNQVNNVLGFPFIFRGALDVRSRAINQEMQIAAVKALAELAKEDVPQNVSRAYGNQKFQFGRDYLIPKPFDRRVLLWVAPAVAEAAMKTGVARTPLNLEDYKHRLESLLGRSYAVMRSIKNRVRARRSEERRYSIVFPEGSHPKILQAAEIVREEGIAEPILLGNPIEIKKQIQELRLQNLNDVRMIRPSESPDFENYCQKLFELRQRRGVTLQSARQVMRNFNYFGSMMVHLNHADGLITGLTQGYADGIRSGLFVIGSKPGHRVSGIYMMILKDRIFFFADTTVNVQPSSEELADIAINTADFASTFTGEQPRVAMLSFSNFGTSAHPYATRVRDAVDIIRKRRPDLNVDGEMQADTAVEPEIIAENFGFSVLRGQANVLVFPDLHSGNIAYKLVSRLGNAEAIGPILVGMNKPVHILQTGSDVTDIVNMAAITAIECARFQT